jgi:signal peptidase I
MRPTLRRGDDVLLDKLGPRLRDPRRRELVTFASPQDGALVLKRVVAVAGDTVEIRDAVLYVNDARVDEPEVDLAAFDATYFGPVCVPAGQVFVLGDNRAGSVDSRTYGGVDVDAVTGRVLFTLP